MHFGAVQPDGSLRIARLALTPPSSERGQPAFRLASIRVDGGAHALLGAGADAEALVM
jgi:hypothetical protein